MAGPVAATLYSQGRVTLRFVLFSLLLFAASAAYGIPYLVLSDDALLLPSDSIAYPFSTGDTIEGRVRLNGPIAISGSPQFYDSVISSAAAIIEGRDTRRAIFMFHRCWMPTPSTFLSSSPSFGRPRGIPATSGAIITP